MATLPTQSENQTGVVPESTTHHGRQGMQICLVPRLAGLGGMVSFQARLVDGLSRRGIPVSFDINDPHNTAVLVIGGTRHWPALWRAQQRRVRIVQRLDGMNWLHRKQKNSLRHYLRAEGSNLLLAFIRRRLATYIVYQSQFSQEWWQRVYGTVSAPSEIIYNGVDLAVFTPDGPEHPPSDKYRLLLVEGHLSRENIQGLENAIRLTELLHDHLHQPMELLVVGNVPESIRSRCPAPDGVAITWSGVVPREQIPAIDRSAHLLFSADLNAACPNAVIEALACGLPVTAFDTGALDEILKNAAGRVSPYGSNYWELQPPVLAPLVTAAADILANNEHFRRAARIRAEAGFGLDRMVDAYLSALSG
jgi:glycosyltransferase involved in cell wall biosynthesis